MSLSVGTVWEVRPTAGSDTNGGGFVAGASGTDYSQQNAANSGGNNSSTADAVGAGSTTLTSATASFTSAIVGNIIYLHGGSGSLAAGWYQVTAFTNSTTITLDRSVASGTGITMNIGGALATISQANTNLQTGNTVYVKASGTYTVTASMTITNPTNPGLVTSYIGYSSSRGDGGQVTWTTATNSTSLVVVGGSGAMNWLFQNFAFTTTAATKATCFDGGLSSTGFMMRISNCSFSSFTVALGLGYVNSVHYELWGLFVDNCEISGCSSHGVSCSWGTFLFGCYIHGNGGDGVHATAIGSGGGATSGPVAIERCVIYNNTGIGCYTDDQLPSWFQIVNSVIYGNGSDGIQLAGGSGEPNCAGLVLINSVIYGNGGYGINNKSSNSLYTPMFYNNAFGSNTSGNYNGAGLAAQPSDITLTAAPFTSPSGNNFTLNSTTGGGALLKNAGFQGTLYHANASGESIDVGAVQEQSGGGGSTTNLIFSLNRTEVLTEEFYT